MLGRNLSQHRLLVRALEPVELAGIQGYLAFLELFVNLLNALDVVVLGFHQHLESLHTHAVRAAFHCIRIQSLLFLLEFYRGTEHLQSLILFFFSWPTPLRNSMQKVLTLQLHYPDNRYETCRMQGRLRGKVNKKLKGYTSYVYATHYAISEFIRSKACSLVPPSL